MHRLPPTFRTLIIYSYDLGMVCLSIALAIFYRHGYPLPSNAEHKELWVLLSLGLPLALIALVFFRVHKGAWRYFSFPDFLVIARVSTTVAVTLILVDYLFGGQIEIRRTVIVTIWFLMTLGLSIGRFFYRWLHVFQQEQTRPKEDKKIAKVPVLVVGCGQETDLFMRSLRVRGGAPVKVVGLVDPQGDYRGQTIYGVPVWGSLEDIGRILEKIAKRGTPARRLLFTPETLRDYQDQVDEAIATARHHGLSIERIALLARSDMDKPSANPALHARTTPINVEDLLGRAPVHWDQSRLSTSLRGKRVLVTGAGGTVGGELSQQLARMEPEKMLLLDHSEYALYKIDEKLGQQGLKTEWEAKLCDIRNRDRVMALVKEFQPHLVFHAAALKHVPIVESHWLDGIQTNIIGTRNVADACLEVGATAMVTISTDKAIHPTSFMGATKRVAEAYCQALDQVALDQTNGKNTPATRFMAVRFGNVFGSSGSVIERFQEQLAQGGPLTVTDPRMVRYFMTIQEAAHLVLQACGYALENPDKRVALFVLDMGEQINIDALARRMIRLAGFEPDRDIAIDYIGLRPGEKLYEELFDDREDLIPTGADKVLTAEPRPVRYEEINQTIDDLLKAAQANNRPEVIRLIETIVDDYQHQYQFT